MLRNKEDLDRRLCLLAYIGMEEMRRNRKWKLTNRSDMYDLAFEQRALSKYTERICPDFFDSRNRIDTALRDVAQFALRRELILLGEQDPECKAKTVPQLKQMCRDNAIPLPSERNKSAFLGQCCARLKFPDLESGYEWSLNAALSDADGLVSRI